MARDALGKLAEADELDGRAAKLMKKDPASARELKQLARGKRKSAIKQLRKRVVRRANTVVR